MSQNIIVDYMNTTQIPCR